MRVIEQIVIHCSATRPGAEVGAADIRLWHTAGNGWKDIGYHFVIRRDGRVENGRDLNCAGAHVAGHNARTIGLCLVGGIDEKGRAESNYTEAQWRALKELVFSLKRRFPKAVVLGHRDFPGVKKDCPCFNARAWAEAEGLN